MNQVAFYIKIYKMSYSSGVYSPYLLISKFSKVFLLLFYTQLNQKINFLYISKVKNQILLIKTFCIFTKVYPVRCCIFFNLDEKNSMERLRTECFFGKITQKERIIKRMAEAKGTFLRPFNKLACFR